VTAIAEGSLELFVSLARGVIGSDEVLRSVTVAVPED
jgi:hypothetical protein